MRKLNHFLIGVFSVVSVCTAVVLLMPSVSLAWGENECSSYGSYNVIICHTNAAGDKETREVSKYAARRHLENHPDDTAGICPVACVGTEPPPLENCPCSGLEAGNAVWDSSFSAEICSAENGNISLTDDEHSLWLSANQGVSETLQVDPGPDPGVFCTVYDRVSEDEEIRVIEGPGQHDACITELLKIAEEDGVGCAPN
jgi:hypothetical protein